MKTTWNKEYENADGSGYVYFYCQCPNERGLYRLHYSPQTSKLWFFDEGIHDSESINMNCDSWENAEILKRMLTQKKSYWMNEKNETI